MNIILIIPIIPMRIPTRAVRYAPSLANASVCDGLFLKVIIGCFLFRRLFAEDRDDIFDRDDKKLIVGFEIDGNCVLGVEENLVVLAERNVFIVFDKSADGDNSSSNGWDFRSVGKRYPPFRFSFGLIFEDKNSRSDRLDKGQVVLLFCHNLREFDGWSVGKGQNSQ